jgi:hypothetical protein
MGLHTLETGKTERLAAFGGRPAWLADSRRLLFIDQSSLYLLNSHTGKQQELLSVAPGGIDLVSASRDDQAIFFSIRATEADIWLAEIQ